MELGKICVSLTGTDAAAVHEQARQVQEQADVLEVRLDYMALPEVEKCCSMLRKPLLFTNRPAWEGGRFFGAEDERIVPLLEAVRLGAAYVDIELRASLECRRHLLEAVQGTATQLIISWHDFQDTPSAAELNEILHQMIASDVHIGKIVTTAQGANDVLRVLALQEHARAAGFPLSCFCMGESGRISRLAALYLGSAMTYASPSASEAAAPGQIAVSRMRELIALLRPE